MNENSIHPLDEHEARLVERLRTWPGATHPRPEFAAQLEADLLAQWHPTPAQDRPRRIGHLTELWGQSMFKRLSLALVGATLALALALSALLGGRQDLPPLPRLVHASGPGSQPVSAGLLAGVELTLATDLPDAPKEVPVYRVTSALPPTTPEEALAWARDFGLPDPQVYRNPRSPETLYVLGSDGQQLVLASFGPMSGIAYGNDIVAAVEGEPLPFDQAAEVAVAFLREHDLLPAAYRVEEPPDYMPSAENPIRVIQIVPELEGHPLVGDTADLHIMVNPAGQVTYANLNTMKGERHGLYPIKSAQKAYEELAGGQVFGSPFRLDTDYTPLPDSETKYYSPPPPAWSSSQPVTVTGQVHVLVAEDRSKVRAQLRARDAQYDLTGPRAAELADVRFDRVQVQGTIVAQMGPHRWRLEVVDWETISVSDLYTSYQCLIGTFTLGGDDAWLVTDDGGRYRLPNAPEELAGGERIWTCSGDVPPEGGDLDWWGITSPPPSESAAYGVGGSTSTMIVVEVPVEEPLPAARAESPFEIGQSVEVEVESSQLLEEWPDQEVVLTGTVHANIFVNGDRRRVEAFLNVGEPGEKQRYPLCGPSELLEAIAQLECLHVRVRGRLVTSPQEGWGPGEIGLEIKGFEKVWPDEHVQGFLGHLDLETAEGREVVVFAESETGQRYVLANPLTGDVGALPMSNLNDEQYFVAGVIQHEETYAGMLVLRPAYLLQDWQTAAATSADEIPLDFPEVVDESLLPPEPERLEGAFVVDRVELVYYYEPPAPSTVSPDGAPVWDQPVEQILQPVWVFHGHNADNTISFVAYVQAVADDYLQ